MINDTEKKHLTIVISDDRFGRTDEERAVFQGMEGVRLVVADCHSEESCMEACARADAVLLNQAPMTRRVVEKLERCRVISRYGIGYDNVDVAAARERGITVCNVPGYCTEEVAEHTLGLLLSCVRAIPVQDSAVRGGRWNLNPKIRRMSGRVLGIVGFGATGRAFWEKVQGFAFSRILVSDPRVEAKIAALAEKRGEKPDVEHVPFETLVACSDFISLHVPLNESTRRFINADTIKKMKDNVIIINTSRGAVMDEGALAEALAQGKIAAAGLDVFETEPLCEDHPFKKLPNVILTGHSAYYSEESVRELKTRTALNARNVLEGKKPLNEVLA